ncbi:MAG: hypothetical protein HW420_1403, partial [Candidatus Nitrosotenuis sp.]|nr:hypothetical protein [Candidatus Nitrosotenuis sp.]
TFNNPTPEVNDFFGWSVSVSGNNVLVNSLGENNIDFLDTGAAYLFDGTTGALLQTFNHPTLETNDQFGWSVSVSGNNVLISADFDDIGALNTGSAYLFLPESVTYCNSMTIEQLITSGLYNVIDNTSGVYGPKVGGTNGADLIILSDLGNHAQGKDGNDCIIGGAVKDVMSGGLGDDQMFGGTGNDHMTGRIGADSMFGEGGNDRMSGGPGNDSVSGGADDDVVFGREDDDTMSGGDGNDYCLGGAGTNAADASCEISRP